MEGLSAIDQCAEHLALPEIPERIPGFEAVPSSAASVILILQFIRP